jgi:hypothetical protein
MNAPDLTLAGVMHDLPAETYHAHEAMSASGAKKILKSPAHFRLMRTKPTKPTDAMQFGTVVHCGVLEPLTFAAHVASPAPDVDRRTREGKAEWSAFCEASAGKIVLSAADYARASRCIAAVREHPTARALLEGAKVEVSMFWRDGRLDVPCKLRADALNHGGIIDLKTTTDASPEGFARQCANLLYHVQGAHYCSGAEHVLDASPEFFAFIAVESEEPHAVACYALPGNAIAAGGHLMNVALERYATARKLGTWPGYAPEITTLKLPRYALQFDVVA